MTKTIFAAISLLLLSLPIAAKNHSKPLTPPEVLSAAKTIQFTATLFQDNKPVESSTAVLCQPNKAYVFDTNLKTQKIDFVYASDGKTQTEYRASHHRYTRSDAPKNIGDIDSITIALTVLTGFYDKASFARFKSAKPGSPIYMRSWRQEGSTSVEVLPVDPRTGLPVVAIIGIMPHPQANKYIQLSHWKLNAPVANSQFAYTPPADATLYIVPGGGLDVGE